MQVLVLDAIPCVVGLLALPLYIAWLWRQPKRRQPISALFVLKLIFSLALANICLAYVIVWPASDDILYRIIYAGWIFVALLSTVVVILERSRDQVRSLPMFMLWALVFPNCLLLLIQSVGEQEYRDDPGLFAMILSRFLVCSGLLLLNCFAAKQPTSQSVSKSPENSASSLSWISYSWLDGFIWQGFRTSLDLEHIDAFTIPEKDTSALVRSRFEGSGSGKIGEPGEGGLYRCLLKTFWWEALVSNVGSILTAASNLVTPIILGWMMDYCQDMDEPAWHGYIYMVAMLLARVVGAVADQTTQWLCNRLAIRVRNATISTIFDKALNMRQNTSAGSGLGEIVNLMSVDSTNIHLFVVYSYWVFSGVLHLVLGALLCYHISGVSMVAGLGFVVIMLIVNVLTNHKVGTYQVEMMAIQDKRLKVVSEVLDGIKVIKLYGWEPLFMQKIIKLRGKELKVLLKIAFFGILETFAFTASKFWMTFCILIMYVFVESSHYLNAKEAFLIINVINIINMAVLAMPLALKLAVKMHISVGRIDEFLKGESLDPEDLHKDKTNEYALKIESGNFKWETSGDVVLKNINIQVKPGQLVAVVGTVGCGKTSLLAAALGEMVRESGYCNLNSTVAYVTQEAWIQNLSIRDNILFGQEMDMSWYQTVVCACSLGPDLEMLPAGDNTEIGEKGINLSGGQKQRVSLARAVYSRADIYLFDDPLSAVDSHVGKAIFQNVIGPNGLLNGKTRVLVTHGLQWLPNVDFVYVMEEGKITEEGTYAKLTASSSGAFAKFVAKHIKSSDKTQNGRINKPKSLPELLNKSESETEFEKTVPVSSSAGGSQLVVSEQVEKTQSKWRVYAELAKTFGPTYVALSAICIAFFHTSFNAFYVKLASWTDDDDLANFTKLPSGSSERENKNIDYILLLAYIGIAQTVFPLVYSTILQCRHVITSKKLHNRLLESVMRAPISFFDTTPMGRILNRFSQDLDSLDSLVFFFLEVSVEHGMFAIGVLVMLSFAIPKLTVVAVVTVVVVVVLQKVYSRVVYSLKRVTSVKSSPVFAHFSETVSGMSVIRASGQQARFVSDNQAKVDGFQRPTYLAYAANKWVQLRFDLIGCCLVLAAAIFVIHERGDIKTGLVGLSLTLAVAITIELKHMSQKSSDLDSSIVGVERILEYTNIKSEAEWTLPSDDTFDEVDTRYQSDREWGNPFHVNSAGPEHERNFDDCNNELKDVPFDKCDSKRKSKLSQGRFFTTNKTTPLKDAISRDGNTVGYYDPAIAETNRTIDNLSKLDLEKRFYTNGVCSKEEKDNVMCRRRCNNSNSWPTFGCIQFDNFACRYRKDTELVLKGISFTIKGGEKVGVVGRTGAGKSSLVLSLFRLVEADQGSIFIDDVDISKLGLHRLRQALTILPQDPVLFSGSIRDNLDPSCQRSDEELWRAIDQAHLKQLVVGMSGQLDASVGDGGGNLSMGQRQLLCLARTLLCQTRVLVLDEATAAVDLETDSLVQDTIRKAFCNCTVIAIAHRLSTILDYDRVLVLDQGKVVEFDSPSRLLGNPESAFYSMAQEAGLERRLSSHAEQ